MCGRTGRKEVPSKHSLNLTCLKGSVVFLANWRLPNPTDCTTKEHCVLKESLPWHNLEHSIGGIKMSWAENSNSSNVMSWLCSFTNFSSFVPSSFDTQTTSHQETTTGPLNSQVTDNKQTYCIMLGYFMGKILLCNVMGILLLHRHKSF